MRTRIETIEQAAAVVGRMVYGVGDESHVLRLSEASEVTHCFAAGKCSFLLCGGATLILPLTLDIVTAQPEQHTGALATWERTVLPALRRAMDAHPELCGAAVKLETTDQAAPTFEVKLSGDSWDYTAEVRRDSVTSIERDCAGLARQAAHESTRVRPEPQPMACPACDGELPSTCRKCSGITNAHGALDAHARLWLGEHAPRQPGETDAMLLERIERRVASVPTRGVDPALITKAWLGDRKVACQFGDGEHAWERTPLNTYVCCNPGCGANVDAEKVRSTTSERTPLPVGWTWDDDPRLLCSASGPGEAWALVETSSVSHNRGYFHNCGPVPPAIHNALITEAARLGLVCHEKPMAAPEGCEFRVHDDGDVEVMSPRRGRGWYFGPSSAFRCSNADPKVWYDDEPARQWAAHMIGEVAPPLREEGAAS